MMRRHAVVACALWVLWIGCESVPLEERPWIEVKSEHFTVLSPDGERDAVRTAKELEVFRKVLVFVTGVDLQPAAVPTVVFVFGGLGSSRPFMPQGVTGDRGYVGEVNQSERETFIVVVDRPGNYEPTEVLQWGYARTALLNQAGAIYPWWYLEGFSNFLSTVKVTQDEVELGLVPSRVAGMKLGHWFPLESVLSADGPKGWDYEKYMAFREESWAFVHYLTFAYQGGDRAKQRLARYLNVIRRGRSVEEAMQTAYGEPVYRMNRQLGRYVGRGRSGMTSDFDTQRFKYIAVPKSVFGKPAEVKTRELSKAAAAMAAGRLSLRIGEETSKKYFEARQLGKFKQAGQFYAAALAAEPNNAHAHAGMGDALRRQERFEEAEPHYFNAIELAPDDPLTHLGLAQLRHDQAKRSEDDGERAALASEARKLYVKSWKLDDTRPEAYWGHGATHVLEGQDPAAGLKNLEYALQLLPSSLAVSLDLARLYGKLGRFEEARGLLRLTASWGRREENKDKVEAVLKELEASEEALSSERASGP